MLYTYQNDAFKIGIVNDRGLIYGELASLYDPGHYFDIYLILALIRLAAHSEEVINPWDKKMMLSNVLSCEEETAVIDDHYTAISNLLSRDQYVATAQSMALLAREHDFLLYGRPK